MLNTLNTTTVYNNKFPAKQLTRLKKTPKMLNTLKYNNCLQQYLTTELLARHKMFFRV